MGKAKSACPGNIRLTQRLFIGGSLTSNLFVPPMFLTNESRFYTNSAKREERCV